MTTPSDPRYDALAELALGTLPEGERPALEAWLATDLAAQAQWRALQEAVGLLALATPDAEPPVHLRDRVLAVTGRSRTLDDTRQTDGPATSTDPRASRATGRRAAASRAWATGGWLAAAASTLLAIGLGWYALGLRADVASLRVALDEAGLRLAAAEADARTARSRLVRAQAETAVLAAADLRRVDLAGQTPAPRAAARAFWSRAQGLVLMGVRLPDLPRGRTYQLWVLTAGAPVSAGVFTPDDTGGVAQVFDTPVSLPTPAGFAVSEEPEGGVPAPTGAIVLAGKAE